MMTTIIPQSKTAVTFILALAVIAIAAWASAPVFNFS